MAPPTLRAWLLAAATFTLAGCAAVDIFRYGPKWRNVQQKDDPRGSGTPPVTDGSRWITVSQPGVTVHTNLADHRGREASQQLAGVRAAVLSWFEVVPDDATKLEAVLFADDSEYERRMGSLATVYSLPATTNDRSLLGGVDRPLGRLDQVFARGLAHRLLRRQYGSLPDWLEEGVVTYLGALELRGRDAVVARLPASISADIRLMPLGELLGGQRLATSRDLALAATTFALVDYLLDPAVFGPKARERFQEWLRLIAGGSGKPEELETAWGRQYAEHDRNQIDKDLAVRFRATFHERSRIVVSDVSAASTAPSVTPLAPEARDSIIARLQELTPEGRERLDEEARFKALAARGRMRQLRLDLHPVAPLQFWSIGYGRLVSRWSGVDLEVGNSPFGPTASARYRLELELPAGLFLAAGAGVWFTVLNETLGLDVNPARDLISDEPETFIHYGFHPELAGGIYLRSGGLIRLSAGMVKKLASEMDQLCGNDRYSTSDHCTRGGFFGPIPEVARQAQLLYVRLGLGYVW